MPIVIGFDTETMEGPPITVQFYSEMMPSINACIWVNEKNVLDKTLRHLSKHCREGQFTIYGHNLNFDLLSIFYPVYPLLVENRGVFEFTHRDWDIRGIYGDTTFCTLINIKRDVTIVIVDGYSWFMGSLAKAANIVCPDLPKLKMPEGLGTKMFTSKDDHFVEYAMRDAQVSYHVGLAVDAMAYEFDLRQPYSVADMAARIFSQHYISEFAPIWNVGPQIAEGAIKSYHGGKNNVIAGAAPAWHTHVDAWDLSSAYPHAMTQMPALSKPRLFRANEVLNKRTRRFPDHGIYQISGKVRPCNWPVLFDDDFKPIRSGEFSGIWITGYELNEARRAEEITLSKVRGHIYDTDKDPNTDTGLNRYVQDFYKLKEEAEDPVMRMLYKVLMNSLYGKFIQKTDVEVEDTKEVRFKPGPLFQPFLASLITGHTRSVMHRLEHQVEAIHTATDGVYCGSRNSPEGGVFDWAPQSGLGSITSEGSDLELALLRNKLYVMYSDNPQDGWHSFHRRGKYVIKYAKHGFQGSPKQLEEACIAGIRNYSVERPNTLKMALKRGKVPNKFERHDMTLNVDQITVHYDWSK